MGPTNLSQLSYVMSAYRSDALLGGVEVWISLPGMSRLKGVVSDNIVPESMPWELGGVLGSGTQ